MAQMVKPEQVTQTVWDKMTPEVRDIFANLVGIRNKLEKIKDSEKPHTAEDIRHYQQMLDAIDSKRDDGIFAGSLKSGSIPPGQAACKEVLDEAYDLLDELLATSSPMNEDMTRTFKVMEGIGRKLAALRQQGHFTTEELRHYEQMLNAVDSARVEGVFCGTPETKVPEGQARCADRLARCYEILEEVKPLARDMEEPVRKIHDQLQGLRDKLRAIKKQHQALKSLPLPEEQQKEVQGIEDELEGVEGERVDGVFAGSSLHVPAGQALLQDMLDDCWKLVRHLCPA